MISIDSLPMSESSAVIGLSRCPGVGAINPLRRGEALRDDIALIADWGAHGILTLNQTAELEWLGVSAIGDEVRAAGMQWWHCPIADFGAPGKDFESAWAEHGPAIAQVLDAGERILIHCLAGLGRAGTIAARLLVEQGMEPALAVSHVRKARPGAIQSEEQMRYLLEKRWRRSNG